MAAANRCFQRLALEWTCANQKNLCKGISIHADILRRGLFGKNIYLDNSLVNLYAKCGLLAKAQEVFDKLPIRNVVSWNTLVAGYVHSGRAEEALSCFKRMQQEHDVFPNAVTYLSILKACASIGAADKGKLIHDDINREGLLEKSIEVGNALVDMYAKCGELIKGQDVFDKLPFRDVVSWNALIAGYADHGHGEEALKCFERMRCEGMPLDAITFVCILKACGSVGAADKGKEIAAEIVRDGLLEKNIVVGNALVDMYLKCGALAKAQEVFDKLPIKDVVSWNVIFAKCQDMPNTGMVRRHSTRLKMKLGMLLDCCEWNMYIDISRTSSSESRRNSRNVVCVA